MMIRTNFLILLLLLFATFAVQTEAESPEAIDSLVKRIEKLEKKEDSKQKDIWDKIGAVSGLVSGILIALIGFYATNIYNRRQKQHDEQRKDQQLSLNQADTLEKFLPHLISDDPRLRESSLLIISTLLGDDLATDLAGKLGGEGSAAALAQIASVSPQKSSASVERALGNVFRVLEPAVVRIAHSGGALIANGFLYGNEGLVVTPAHVADMLPSDFVLHTARGIALNGKVVYLNKKLDIAFIETPDVLGISGVSTEAITPHVGTKVVSLWHSPQTGLLGEVGNIISDQVPSPNTQQTAIGVTKMGSPGISGAPVIDTSGKFVGVIYASTRGDNPMTLLIPASLIKEGLADYRSKG